MYLQPISRGQVNLEVVVRKMIHRWKKKGVKSSNIQTLLSLRMSTGAVLVLERGIEFGKGLGGEEEYWEG